MKFLTMNTRATAVALLSLGSVSAWKETGSIKALKELIVDYVDVKHNDDGTWQYLKESSDSCFDSPDADVPRVKKPDTGCGKLVLDFRREKYQKAKKQLEIKEKFLQNMKKESLTKYENHKINAVEYIFSDLYTSYSKDGKSEWPFTFQLDKTVKLGPLYDLVKRNILLKGSNAQKFLMDYFNRISLSTDWTVEERAERAHIDIKVFHEHCLRYNIHNMHRSSIRKYLRWLANNEGNCWAESRWRMSYIHWALPERELKKIKDHFEDRYATKTILDENEKNLTSEMDFLRNGIRDYDLASTVFCRVLEYFPGRAADTKELWNRPESFEFSQWIQLCKDTDGLAIELFEDGITLEFSPN